VNLNTIKSQAANLFHPKKPLNHSIYGLAFVASFVFTLTSPSPPVMGLASLTIDHPLVCYTGVSPAIPTGITPSAMRKAYGLDQVTGTGQGVTIAIVDAYRSLNIQSDLDFFDSTFNLPALTLTIAQPGGVPGTNAGWATETALDVEWAHSIAPAANILLVEALTASADDLVVAVD